MNTTTLRIITCQRQQSSSDNHPMQCNDVYTEQAKVKIKILKCGMKKKKVKDELNSRLCILSLLFIHLFLHRNPMGSVSFNSLCLSQYVSSSASASNEVWRSSTTAETNQNAQKKRGKEKWQNRGGGGGIYVRR